MSLLPAEAAAALREAGFPGFRAAQLGDWVYGKLVTDPAKMTTFSAADRGRIGGLFSLLGSEVVAEQASTDGTRKLLLQWPESIEAVRESPGRTHPLLPLRAGVPQAETVMIPDGERRTACVSSQVGCPVGCRFCASGLAGVKGNLTPGQIVEQVYRLDLLLAEDGKRISNVVFMGMGEPLANYANVMKAIRILHDPDCFNLSARRITLSTVGVAPRIRELAKEELPINLALSLHAPNEALRKQLIPWAEHFPLAEVLAACREYFETTGREITLEYILLQGVNDRPEHARELVRLCRGLRANVNLIRYNEVAGLEFRRPTAEDVNTFQEILRGAGVNAHLRKSRGRDIDAACGQLRRKQGKGITAEDASRGPAAREET